MPYRTRLFRLFIVALLLAGITQAAEAAKRPRVGLVLGGETPFGPAYVGIGHSRRGITNLFLFVGTP
jgi:hypothetical protein